MQDNKLIKSLVMNAQLGNNSAFEQLYQMTVEQIYALTLRLTASSDHAEKFTKQTYINAWQIISQKDEFISFASWLKKVAVQTVVNSGVWDKLESSAADNQIFLTNPLENHIRDLDFQSRLVYVLHDIENFSVEEISKLSSITERDVKKMLINTREKLINLTEE